MEEDGDSLSTIVSKKPTTSVKGAGKDTAKGKGAGAKGKAEKDVKKSGKSKSTPVGKKK